MSPNPHGCPRQGQATRSCIHNGTGLTVLSKRRLDMMESQTIGYQPMMAGHRGETETPMPISGIVGELISGFLMKRVSLSPGQLKISAGQKTAQDQTHYGSLERLCVFRGACDFRATTNPHSLGCLSRWRWNPVVWPGGV